MRTLTEINGLLSEFEKRFGEPVVGAQQGSAKWAFLKLGVISASRAKDLVAKKDSETRLTYMSELVAQVATGIFRELDGIPALEWGKSNEDAARACYEFQTGHTVTQLPFVFRDDTFRVGCSPDGIVTTSKGVEIKCPYSTENYIKFLAAEKIKSDYQWQNEFTLWVMEASEWDFVQYDPRMKANPLHIKTVVSDPEKRKTLDDAVPQFIEDMDRMLARIGVRFGDQWISHAKSVRAV